MKLQSNENQSKDAFWMGKWRYTMPHRKEGRMDVIVRLCFGPLVKETVGYKDGGFFREIHHIEDEWEENTEVLAVTPADFFQELKQEIILSIDNHCPLLTEALEQMRDELLAAYNDSARSAQKSGAEGSPVSSAPLQ